MLGEELKQASIHVVAGHSLVVPLVVERLPATIAVLGREWQRKREFHLTAVAARVIEGLGVRHAWEQVAIIASGRCLGPIVATTEIRRVRSPDDPGLETLIVMAQCAGLVELYGDLSAALGTSLTPPPPHVTLYSTDPTAGIGIATEAELGERAPALPEPEQDEVRRAIGFAR